MSALSVSNIERMKALNSMADAVGRYFERHAERIAPSNVDKHGAQFDRRTDRFAAFHVSATFTCHTGVYGSSSCSTDLSLRTEEVEPYFVRAMAKHQQLLFATAAELMRHDAAALTEKARAEIDALTAMVESLNAPALSKATHP